MNSLSDSPRPVGSPPPKPYTIVPGRRYSTVAAGFISRRENQNKLHTLAQESVFTKALSASVQKKDSLGTRKKRSDADKGPQNGAQADKGRQNGAQKKRRMNRGPQGSVFVSESEVHGAIGDLGGASGGVKRVQPQTQEPQYDLKLGAIFAREERSQGLFSESQNQVPSRRPKGGPPPSALKALQALGSPEQSTSQSKVEKKLTPGGEEVNKILCGKGSPKESPSGYVSPPPWRLPEAVQGNNYKGLPQGPLEF